MPKMATAVAIGDRRAPQQCGPNSLCREELIERDCSASPLTLDIECLSNIKQSKFNHLSDGQATVSMICSVVMNGTIRRGIYEDSSG